ncbi:MAG: hypothetical protein AAGD35_18090 [Actinomycetota bacterium]
MVEERSAQSVLGDEQVPFSAPPVETGRLDASLRPALVQELTRLWWAPVLGLLAVGGLVAVLAFAGGGDDEDLVEVPTGDADATGAFAAGLDEMAQAADLGDEGQGASVATVPGGQLDAAPTLPVRSELDDDDDGAGDGGSTTTTPTSSRPSSTVVSTTTTAPTTIRPTTTTAPPTTAAPTTTASTPSEIRGEVLFANGAGARGIEVLVQFDDDGDGLPDRYDRVKSTEGDGSYVFAVDPGCHVITVRVPDGQYAIGGSPLFGVCVEPGERSGDHVVTLSTPDLPSPSACYIQIGSGFNAGVEIWEYRGRWAPHYLFFDAAGRVIHSTADFGEPDDVEPREPSIEWTSRVHGFDESDVYFVAAGHPQGASTTPLRCDRVNSRSG